MFKLINKPQSPVTLNRYRENIQLMVCTLFKQVNLGRCDIKLMREQITQYTGFIQLKEIN